MPKIHIYNCVYAVFGVCRHDIVRCRSYADGKHAAKSCLLFSLCRFFAFPQSFSIPPIPTCRYQTADISHFNTLFMLSACCQSYFSAYC